MALSESNKESQVVDMHFGLIRSVLIADCQDVVVVMKLNGRAFCDGKWMSVGRKYSTGPWPGLFS